VVKNFFDIETRNFNEIEIFENYSKSNCYISLKKNHSHIFNGFILNKKKIVMTICEVTFFRSSTSKKYVPRLTFEKCDMEYNTKTTKRRKVIVSFSRSIDGYENFWKMIGFLNRFKKIVDLGEFDRSFEVMDKNTYYKIYKNNNNSDKILELIKLAESANLTEHDIKNILSKNRKTSIDIFKRLLDEPGYVQKYRKQYSSEIKKPGDEAVFHHFLKENKWIIGLNVDIRFIRDLIPEENLGISNTNGKGSPIGDFIGISDYTLLIELKTPSTDIFTLIKKKSTSRANTWSFSDHFIDGVSQCLGQKFVWDKSHKNKDLVIDGKIKDQNIIRTIDPKFIFIIGNKKKEFHKENTSPDNIIKRDTFQLFRRNNRNLEIITYDELYERAYFIVYDKPVDDVIELPVFSDDVPF
jgi:hypothetical protein